MSDWRVVYTEQAERDLRDIFEYIAFALLESDTAKAQAGRIMQAIKRLNALPMRFPLYENEPWRSMGLRRIPVDHYVVFYLPVEKQQTVAVVRIMYGGRDIAEQMRQTETPCF